MKPVLVWISALAVSTTIISGLTAFWSTEGTQPKVGPPPEPDTSISATDSGGAAEIAVLRRELAEVEERLTDEFLELRADVAASHQRAPLPTTASEDPPGESARIEEEAQEHHYAEILSNLERQLLESRDSAWAPGAEATLGDFYNQATEGAEDIQLVSAECRATLCRVEVMGRPGSEVQQLSGRMPWDGNGFFRHSLDADGRSIMVGYISREGSGLPVAR